MATCLFSTVYAAACTNNFATAASDDTLAKALELQLIYLEAGGTETFSQLYAQACLSGFDKVASDETLSAAVELQQLYGIAGGPETLAQLYTQACDNSLTTAADNAQTSVAVLLELWCEIMGGSCATATLTAGACTNGFMAASTQATTYRTIKHQLLLNIAGSGTVTALIDAACDSGFMAASNDATLARALKLQLLCNVSAAGPVVDPAVTSFVSRSGITDVTQIAAVTALVAAAKANGWWDQCDLIYPFVGGTAGAHAQNLKSTSFTITWAGTVTHDANGITGNGTTGYGDTGYLPSTGPLWTQNSAHIGVYRRTAGGTLNRDYIGASSAGPLIAFSGRGIAATSFRGDCNAVGAFTFVGALALAWNVCARIAAADIHGYSGATDATAISLSTGNPAAGLYVLARNTSGVAGTFSNANLAGATAGSGLTFVEYGVMAADWQTFNTALSRQV